MGERSGNVSRSYRNRLIRRNIINFRNEIFRNADELANENVDPEEGMLNCN